MQNETIIAKIQKCLSLSKSSNRHEAALVIERAQALMGKYGITHMDVEMAEISGRRTDATRNVSPPRHIALLVNIINAAFGCKSIFCPEFVSGRLRHMVEFVGFGPNPEIAVYVFSVLRRQIERERRKYLTTLSTRMKRSNKTRLAANWTEGWLIGVYRKVQAMALDDHQRAQLENWIKQRYNQLIETKARRLPKAGQKGFGAFLDGQAAGSKVALRRGVNTTKKQPLLPGKTGLNQ